jgi:hypothetical protein
MEEWKDIPGYEGLYQISDHGNVRSIDRTVKNGIKGYRFIKGQPIESCFESALYPIVRLCKDNKYTSYQVHRLLGIVFIPNPNDLPMIDHIDRNPKNNHISNLRWVTHSQNQENRGIPAHNKLGEHYISFNKGDYRVRIKRNDILHSKTFKTLDEAKDFRDSLLN